jgi:hypothetical protein
MTEFEVPRRQLSSKFVFTLASVKDHSKLSANRNFVVKLEHFGVKRRKNYRIRGSKNWRERSQKLGRREKGWEKKNERQSGKCRGEEADRVDRRKWMGSAERE